jgi:Tfp pilus assembly protein PilX
MLGDSATMKSGPHNQRATKTSQRRRGTVMIVCVFVEVIVTIMVLNVLDSLRVQSSTMHSVETHQQAIYLAESGVRHAQVILQKDPAFRGSIEWNDQGTRLETRDVSRSYVVKIVTAATGEVSIVSEGFHNAASYVQVVIISKGS